METISNINLQRFCATEAEPREYLRRPWRVGKWVYATNMRLALRVPASAYPEVEPTSRFDHLSALFSKWVDERQCEFVDMPSRQPVCECDHCHGRGHVLARCCDDCTGGTFVHGNHEYGCKNCMGSVVGPGWIKVDDERATRRCCVYCDGIGFDMWSSGVRAIGDVTYSNVYLNMLAELPNCRICPGSENEPAALEFDGGHALLMPRRP